MHCLALARLGSYEPLFFSSPHSVSCLTGPCCTDVRVQILKSYILNAGSIEICNNSMTILGIVKTLGIFSIVFMCEPLT